MRLRQLSDIIDLNFERTSFILIYGNDAPLRSFVQEMVRQQAKETGIQVDFSTSINDISQSSASLFDAPRTHHLNIIAKVGEKDFAKVQDLASAPNSRRTILATGDTLTTKGKFVTAALEQSNSLAIPCYEAKPAEFQNLLNRILKKRTIVLEPAVAKKLLEFMVDFPHRFFQEIDKIHLYLESNPTLAPQALGDLLGASDAFNLDLLIQSILMRNLKDIPAHLPLSFVEDEFYLIVRSLSKILMQLSEILAHTAQGLSFAQAQTHLSTPIFFKIKPLLETASGKWKSSDVTKAIMTLWDLEKRFKNQEISPLNTIAALKSLAS